MIRWPWVLYRLQRLGLSIPEDLGIVGFDDIPEAAYFYPPLTTVRQDTRRLGAMAVERMNALIQAQDEEETLEPDISWLEPRLIVRKSSVRDESNQMKHRERVEMALNHERPDRCPMQISFTPEFADRLRADMELQGKQVHNPHGGGNTYELERSLGEDMLLTSVGWANSYYMDSKPYVDEWGVGWKIQPYETPFGQGYYTGDRFPSVG